MAEPTIIIQVKLRNAEKPETLVTWIDKKQGLKVGSNISLKDWREGERWIIEELYPTEHSSKDFNWHRKWDNNI